MKLSVVTSLVLLVITLNSCCDDSCWDIPPEPALCETVYLGRIDCDTNHIFWDVPSFTLRHSDSAEFVYTNVSSRVDSFPIKDCDSTEYFIHRSKFYSPNKISPEIYYEMEHHVDSNCTALDIRVGNIFGGRYLLKEGLLKPLYPKQRMYFISNKRIGNYNLENCYELRTSSSYELGIVYFSLEEGILGFYSKGKYWMRVS